MPSISSEVGAADTVISLYVTEKGDFEISAPEILIVAFEPEIEALETVIAVPELSFTVKSLAVTEVTPRIVASIVSVAVSCADFIPLRSSRLV